MYVYVCMYVYIYIVEYYNVNICCAKIYYIWFGIQHTVKKTFYSVTKTTLVCFKNK